MPLLNPRPIPHPAHPELVEGSGASLAESCGTKMLRQAQHERGGEAQHERRAEESIALTSATPVCPDQIRASSRACTTATSARWLPRIKSGATSGASTPGCIKFTPHSKYAPQTRRRPLNHPARVSTSVNQIGGRAGQKGSPAGRLATSDGRAFLPRKVRCGGNGSLPRSVYAAVRLPAAVPRRW